jgi:hypothetical protein
MRRSTGARHPQCTIDVRTAGVPKCFRVKSLMSTARPARPWAAWSALSPHPRWSNSSRSGHRLAHNTTEHQTLD